MTQIVPLPDVTVPTIGPALHGGVLSIGNFDGVHQGHQSLLRQTRALADQVGGPAIACLFDPHPIALLRPDAAPMRLTSVTERARRMESLGIDFLVVCKTSTELLNLTAEEFFRSLVCNVLRCGGMVEGENFCFGKNRQGNVTVLRQWCEQSEIEFRVASMELFSEEMISSTRIREALVRGDVALAASMMATPHRIDGVVVRGDGRGRTIGFPTANLAEIKVVVPAPAVYAGYALLDGVRHPAAIHLGKSPTFNAGTDTKVEVHLIGYDGDLYDKPMTVEFVDRIRDAMRFDSADDLVKQLNADMDAVKQRLSDQTDRT